MAPRVGGVAARRPERDAKVAARGHRVKATIRAGWWASFVAFALLGVVWALSVPPMSGPDEMAHVVKAAAVIRGELQTDVRWEEDPFWGFRVPRTDVDVPKGYDNDTLTSLALCWNTFSDEVVPLCRADLPSEAGASMETNTYVGTYQPAYYAAVGWPTRFLGPAQGVLGVRIVSAILVAALLASALTTAAEHGGPFSVVASVLAITPAFVYIAGVVNPSSIEIAASLGLWSALLALAATPLAPRRVVLRAAVAAVCLISVRPLSPAIALAIVAAVAVVAAERDGLRELWARRSVRLASAGVAVVWLVSAAHVLAADAFNSIIVGTAVEQRSTFALVRDASGNTLILAREQVGLLGPLGIFSQRAPAALVDAWIVLVVALVVGALVVGPARRRAGLALVLVGSLVAPVVAALANPDAMWLGRYSFPLVIGVPVVAAWTLDRSGRVPARVGAGVVAAVSLLAAAVHLVDYRGLFRRNLFDYPDALSASYARQLWDGPFTAGNTRLLAFAASVAVAGAGLLWAAVLARRENEAPPTEVDQAAAA